MLVRGDGFSEPTDVTPPGFNVRTTVHEYGGGAYLVHGGIVYFSNFADQRLYRQDAGGEPVSITPDTGGRDRYADGRITPDGRSLVCVRERHPEPDDPSGVVNGLVRSHRMAPASRTIRSGRDFYSTPRIAPDGSRLSWLEWDLPWMPWDGCELVVGDLAGAGVSGVRRVAGRVGEESIFQPTWSPDGELHFASDRTGWWNLAVERNGGIQGLHPADAEFGWPQWVFGMTAYGFLGDGRIACLWERDGLQHLAILDPLSGELIDLDVPHTAMTPQLDVEGDRVVFVGGGPATPDEVVVLDVTARSIDVLRSSFSVVDEAAILDPPADRVPHGGGADGVRALLSAVRPRRGRTGGRAAARDRDEPWGTDGRSHAALLPGDPVLDEPRVRRRGRELRREHGIRTGVPTAAPGHVGDRRHSGLHQRGGLVGLPGGGRTRIAS